MNGAVSDDGMNSLKRCGMIGRHPGADRGREGRLHEGAADQRRVERVLPQTAEQRLAQPDRGETGHGAHPQREGGRQRKRQQHAGDGRRSSRTANCALSRIAIVDTFGQPGRPA